MMHAIYERRIDNPTIHTAEHMVMTIWIEITPRITKISFASVPTPHMKHIVLTSLLDYCIGKSDSNDIG